MYGNGLVLMLCLLSSCKVAVGSMRMRVLGGQVGVAEAQGRLNLVGKSATSELGKMQQAQQEAAQKARDRFTLPTARLGSDGLAAVRNVPAGGSGGTSYAAVVQGAHAKEESGSWIRAIAKPATSLGTYMQARRQVNNAGKSPDAQKAAERTFLDKTIVVGERLLNRLPLQGKVQNPAKVINQRGEVVKDPTTGEDLTQGHLYLSRLKATIGKPMQKTAQAIVNAGMKFVDRPGNMRLLERVASPANRVMNALSPTYQTMAAKLQKEAATVDARETALIKQINDLNRSKKLTKSQQVQLAQRELQLKNVQSLKANLTAQMNNFHSLVNRQGVNESVARFDNVLRQHDEQTSSGTADAAAAYQYLRAKGSDASAASPLLRRTTSAALDLASPLRAPQRKASSMSPTANALTLLPANTLRGKSSNFDFEAARKAAREAARDEARYNDADKDSAKPFNPKQMQEPQNAASKTDRRVRFDAPPSPLRRASS